MTTSREKLNKKPIDYANNSINFLNGLTENYLKNANIKDIILSIMCAKKLVNKYHHLDTVQAKIDIMAHQMGFIRDMFPYLRKDSHSFGKKKELCWLRMNTRISWFSAGWITLNLMIWTNHCLERQLLTRWVMSLIFVFFQISICSFTELFLQWPYRIACVGKGDVHVGATICIPMEDIRKVREDQVHVTRLKTWKIMETIWWRIFIRH